MRCDHFLLRPYTSRRVKLLRNDTSASPMKRYVRMAISNRFVLVACLVSPRCKGCCRIVPRILVPSNIVLGFSALIRCAGGRLLADALLLPACFRWFCAATPVGNGIGFIKRP